MTGVAGGPGYKTAERVRDYVVRHGLLRRGEGVVVGVSGGPDSTCLLHALARLDLDLAVVVAHVDHGLSDGSAEVAARVARDVAEAGFDVHVARAGSLAGPNLQEKARDFRYSFFQAIAEQEGAAVIATGHTLDDRVETTLARLIHGSGTDGLAGIRPRAGSRIHPILCLRRAETRAYCEEVGADFYDDPGNKDPRYERNAVREQLVGAIEERWGDGGVRAVATSIDRVAEDSDALLAQATTLFGGLARAGSNEVLLDLDTMLGLPRALRRRILELAVGRVRDRSGGIDEALDALEDGARNERRFSLAAGGEITILKDRIRVMPPQPGPPKKH